MALTVLEERTLDAVKDMARTVNRQFDKAYADSFIQDIKAIREELERANSRERRLEALAAAILSNPNHAGTPDDALDIAESIMDKAAERAAKKKKENEDEQQPVR